MFGMNRQIIGRLNADATIYNLLDGGRVVNITIATDERCIDKTTGDILLVPDGRVQFLKPINANAT